MASPHEIAENRQGELLYLSSRLMSAIFAFHRDAERSQPDRNLWWHVHLNTALRLVLIQVGATRAMTISSDVPFVVMKAVEWLKVEDICEDLADLPGVNLPEFWPYVLRDNYASDWWNRPGVEPGLFNTWDRAYIEDLENYKAEFLQMEPADAESMWSTRTRPILKIGLQPTAPGVREQLTKLIDHVRSEMEDIRFSNHSIEVTMAALETIQQRHPAPAAADNTKAVTLNAQDLEEFLRMKREQVSPGPLSFRDPESGTEDDMEHGGSTTAPEDNNEDQVEMEEDNRVGRTRDTTSTASSQAFTEVSSTGLGDIIPSDDMLSDDSSEGTSIASSGLDFEGPELAATTPDPSGGSLTPTIPTHTAASFRGPVKFPSRQRPMPFALGLVDTPSPSDALTPPVSEGPSHPQPRSSSSSDSSVEATSPVPIVASQTKRTRSKATRQQPASEVIDLTAPTRTMRSAAGGSKHINPAPAGTSTRQNTGSKAASGAARSGGRGVMDITDSPLTSLPSSLAH